MQAYRPGDREMLASSAGRELVVTVVDALNALAVLDGINAALTACRENLDAAERAAERGDFQAAHDAACAAGHYACELSWEAREARRRL